MFSLPIQTYLQQKLFDYAKMKKHRLRVSSVEGCGERNIHKSNLGNKGISRCEPLSL